MDAKCNIEKSDSIESRLTKAKTSIQASLYETKEDLFNLSNDKTKLTEDLEDAKTQLSDLNHKNEVQESTLQNLTKENVTLIKEREKLQTDIKKKE